MSTWPSPGDQRLGTPNIPAIRFTRGNHFGASWFAHLLRPASLLAPLHGSDWDTSPANGSVYFQAFGVSVTLPAAGYHYDIDWTPMSAGFAPAGMKASFAARSPRYPGDPSRAFASVHDPGRIDAPSPIDGCVDAAPARTTAKASASWLYRGYCGASAPAAYASRMVLPPSMQGSLPAGWLAFTGRELNPLDRDEGFQITSSSSLPGLFPGATSANLHTNGSGLVVGAIRSFRARPGCGPFYPTLQ